MPLFTAMARKARERERLARRWYSEPKTASVTNTAVIDEEDVTMGE